MAGDTPFLTKKQVWLAIAPDGRWHACDSESEARGFAASDGQVHQATLEWPAVEPGAEVSDVNEPTEAQLEASDRMTGRGAL